MMTKKQTQLAIGAAVVALGVVLWKSGTLPQLLRPWTGDTEYTDPALARVAEKQRANDAFLRNAS